MLIFGWPLLLALHRGQSVGGVLLQGYLQLLCALLILSEPTSTSWLHWSLEHSQWSFPDIYIALGHWVEVYPKLENHIWFKREKDMKRNTLKLCPSKGDYVQCINFPLDFRSVFQIWESYQNWLHWHVWKHASSLIQVKKPKGEEFVPLLLFQKAY